MIRQTGRRLILVVLAQILILSALAAWIGHWDGAAAPAFAATAPGETMPCRDTSLSYRQPFEVPVYASRRQTDFDCFSWRSLVALNWPASSQNAGQPDPQKRFGEPGDLNLVVWQTFKQPEVVFLPTGGNPCPECPDPPTPDCLKRCWNRRPNLHALASTSQVLSLRSKVAMSATRQAVPNAWLTDQDKNLARYEIRINEPSFNYIVANKLYNGKYQKDSKIAADFPLGRSGDQVGGISIKAAWKILVRPEDRSRYLSMEATIHDSKVNPRTGYDDPKNGVYLTCGAEGPLCKRTVGLVGFHIAHKAKDNDKWVWSTFEHEDNAPLDGTSPARGYSFYDPRCVERYGPDLCKPNQNPQRVKDVDMRRPVQVTRIKTPDILPDDVNAQWHQLVKGTPWERYVLVSTQWVNREGAFVPEVLSNTTMESYIQDRGPRTASCLRCHSFASTLAGKTGDFVYLLSNAQPRK
jgi:hypothetical protein